MAVYKSSYCYPFSNSFDARLVPTYKNHTPYQLFKCKVETSNKNVTGYRIKILDEQNNIIFQGNKISPISELTQFQNNDLINSGLNGTYLYIPVFQSKISPQLHSYNAVYYTAEFTACYVTHVDSNYEGAENVNNWEYDSDTQELFYRGWDGILNGEMLMKGDTVLFPTDDDKSGIWEVTITGRLKRCKKYSGIGEIDSDTLQENGTTVIITQGDYKTEKTVYSDSTWNFFDAEESPLWVGYKEITTATANTGFINFSNRGKNYKWIITLYQGKGEVKEDTDNDESSIKIQYIDYKDLDNTWRDMKLTSGSVLGSNAQRIQLAEFKPVEERINEVPSFPGENSANVIVIQGRYAQLCNKTTDSITPIGNRAYVKTYDSSFGHIYPEDGVFSDNLIEAASHCVFYKHSNVEGSIKESDIVDYATDDNINFEDEMDIGDIESILNATITDTTKVLLMGQTNSYENGVWLFTNGAPPTRSGSFNTWASFIGKVVYVRSGTFGGKNFESQAPALGTLWQYGDDTDGSYLIFNEEQPILVYPNQIEYTVDYCIKDITVPTISSTTKFDGYKPQAGDIIALPLLTPLPGIYIVKEDNNGLSLRPKTSLQKDKYVKVLRGKTHGNKVVYITSDSTDIITTYSPYMSTILKNGEEYTYIKPFIGLEAGMSLYFPYKQIYADNVPFSWLNITGVNTKCWAINHKQLDAILTPFSSIDNSQNYDYELRSFFKASDENPFSLYDAPYLRLDNGVGGYTDFDTYMQYMVQNEDDTNIWDPFCVYYNNPDYDESDSESPRYLNGHGIFVHEGEDEAINFNDEEDILEVFIADAPFCVKSPGLTAISQRQITLTGAYIQGQQASWESYRWVLSNNAGEVIQDTGKKYDKTMTAKFYGLSNEEPQNLYYATLFVEDDLHQSLNFTLKLLVDPNSSTLLESPFTVEYDCATHSNILSYEKNGYVKPSILEENSGYEVVYASDNISQLHSGAWDNSLIYTTDKKAVICGPSREQNYIPVFYSNDTYLSKAAIFGLRYTNYFNSAEMKVSANSNNLSLPGVEDGGTETHQMLFQTDITLDENYCGQILKLTYDANQGGTNRLDLTLTIPDIFTSSTEDTLNTNRNKIAFLFEKITDNGDPTSIGSERYLKKGANDDYTRFNIPTNLSTPPYYLLNDSGVSGTEFVHYNKIKEKYFPWFYRHEDDKTNSSIRINSQKFLGNGCLVGKGDFDEENTPDTPSYFKFRMSQANYWVEYRHKFKLVKFDCTGNIYTNVSVNEQEEDLYWPSESGETSYYWIEAEGTENSNLPEKWNQIHNTVSGSDLVNMTAYKRHPGTKHQYRITIRIFDVDAIYNINDDFTVSGDSETITIDSKGYTNYITEVNVSDATKAQIELMQIDV